jgi:hypothetical protein
VAVQGGSRDVKLIDRMAHVIGVTEHQKFRRTLFESLHPPPLATCQKIAVRTLGTVPVETDVG